MRTALGRLFGLIMLATALSACASLASLTADSFTFEGQLPTNFSMRAQAHYGVANGCKGRSQARSFESGFQDAPQQYRFNIPVSYRDGLCEMQLARVGLYIHGRYGEKDWQRTYDNGGLVLVDTLPQGAPAFEPDGRLSKTAECTWLFQLSKAHSRKGQVSKLLSCKDAGAHLVRDELPGKTVRLDIQANPKERPYYDDTWIRLPQGWKPCLPKEGGWIRCQTPPVFQTFKMNGQECTVYPNCKE